MASTEAALWSRLAPAVLSLCGTLHVSPTCPTIRASWQSLRDTVDACEQSQPTITPSVHISHIPKAERAAIVGVLINALQDLARIPSPVVDAWLPSYDACSPSVTSTVSSDNESDEDDDDESEEEEKPIVKGGKRRRS
jgi:hypothetical protein